MAKSKVTESIADRPSINHQIERQLKQHEPAMQTRILDALEAVKDAGDAGLRPQDWANSVKRLHPDADYNVGDLLKSIVRSFKFCIRRNADGAYCWTEEDTDGGTDVCIAMVIVLALLPNSATKA